MKIRQVSLLLIIVTVILIFSIAYSQEPLKKGQDFLKTEDYIKAKEFFQKFTENPEVADQALLGVAKAEYYLRNYYEATVFLKRLLRDFKNSPCVNEANLFMGLSYLKIGRLRDAENYFKKVEQPFTKQAMVGSGWIALQRGDLKTVESVLNSLEKKDFNDPEAALLKIKYLSLTGKHEEALKELSKNLKLKKTVYDIDKAEILIKAGKFSEAETILKKFIDKAKRLSDALRAKKILFELYVSQNNIQEAVKIGREIYFHIPTDEIRLTLYSIYINQKNYDEALKMLFVLRDKDLKNKKTEEFLKSSMHETPEKATFYIMKVYPFLPSDSSILVESANFLISCGKFNEAKNLLRKIMTGPRRAEAVLPYSKILIKENKYKEAKKLLEPLKDKNEYAMALYAWILESQGDKTTALTYLRKLSKSIKDPDILTVMGDLEYSVGLRKKAIFYWLKASSMGDAQATLKAADYFYLSKETKKAVQYYKKTIDMGINDSNSLMWAYYQYGKLANDRTYLEKVANSNCEFSEAVRAILEKP